MIKLEDRRWKTFLGGYRMPYDASSRLKDLKAGGAYINSIWEELWNELHHQGDVDVASYAAVPYLAQIGVQNQLVDWNLFALTAVIEECRVFGKNPSVPEWLQNDYHSAIKTLAQFGASRYSVEWSEELVRSFMAVAAFAGGFANTGRVLIDFNNQELKKVVEGFFP